jgi:hypothetical protein
MSLVQPYFAHDINAVNDFKIQTMMYEFGVSGYGMFWVICEALASQKSCSLPLKESYVRALSSKAMVDVEQMNHFIKSCCEEYELFVTDGESIWSESLSKRMEKSRSNVDRAKRAAKARWSKPKSKPKSDSPTKKSTNKIKAVSIEDRKLTFGESLSPFVEEFGRDMVKNFYEYWTEHGDNDTKMRFEKQKTWSTKSRLNRWRSNNFGGNKKESVSTNNIFNFGN